MLSGRRRGTEGLRGIAQFSLSRCGYTAEGENREFQSLVHLGWFWGRQTEYSL